MCKKDSGVCEHCGHCRHCGRGGNTFYPAPYWPYQPIQPWPNITWGGGSTSDTITNPTVGGGSLKVTAGGQFNISGNGGSHGKLQ